MLVPGTSNIHLTYCLNVHPGETWEENYAAIREKAVAVKQVVAPDKPFGLGLRLSAIAAQTLSQKEVMADFRRFLDENQLYVFTFNGFPYGSFHGRVVKSDVYRPDWRTTERRDYTNLLGDILAELLPEDVPGSISTVPGAYRQSVRNDADMNAMVRGLSACAVHLSELHDRTGKHITVALEPEPDCFVENTEEAIRLLAGPLAEAGGESAAEHLGVCVDVCHLAVEFEDPRQGIERLVKAGLNVAKVQLSSALRCVPTPAALQRLREFCDPVYLHQVKVRSSDGRISSYADLPEALARRGADAAPGEEWRVHFHVPLYVSKYGELRSTGDLYTPALAKLLTSGAVPHLEIETYTFDVLPEAVRESDVVRSIAREYEWALNYLGSR